jgi:ParB family transcriptional regulator, chromosome partitioning protein
LSVGHAKVILGLTRPEVQRLAAERVLKQTLNVRQTEHLAARLQQRGAAGATAAARGEAKDAQVAEIERRLRERLGTKVELRYRQGKGTVQIHYFNDEDLARVLELIGVQLD